MRLLIPNELVFGFEWYIFHWFTRAYIHLVACNKLSLQLSNRKEEEEKEKKKKENQLYIGLHVIVHSWFTQWVN